MPTKNEITQNARRLINEMGYESFRLDDLLIEMSLSKGGFYHHFKSVNLLLEELIIEDFSSDFEAVDAILNSPSVKDAIIQLFQSLSTQHDADEGVLKSLNSETNLKLYLNILENVWYEPFKQKLSNLLSNGVKTHELPNINIFVICELFDAINRHANRSTILKLWDQESALLFHQATIKLLSEQLCMQDEFDSLLLNV